jgi:hypothetical protein
MSSENEQVFLASWFTGITSATLDDDLPPPQAVMFRGSPTKGERWIRVYDRGRVDKRFQPTVYVQDLSALAAALQQEREERKRAGSKTPMAGKLYEIPLDLAPLVFPGVSVSTSQEHIQRLRATVQTDNVDVEGAEAESERMRQLLDRLGGQYELGQIPRRNLARSDE